jgi:hypothetical protein
MNDLFQAVLCRCEELYDIPVCNEEEEDEDEEDEDAEEEVEDEDGKKNK